MRSVPGVSTEEHWESIRLFTFNAGLLDFRVLGMTVYRPTDYVEERAAALPGALLSVNADIIALQEVYDQRHIGALVEALSARFPFYIYERTAAFGLDNGLLVFSRLPIQKAQMLVMGTGPLDEAAFASKSVMIAQLGIGNGETLAITNVHLTSGGLVNAQDSDEVIQIRSDQLDAAIELSQSLGANHSVVLGDFNAGPKVATSNYQHLTGLGYRDVYLAFCIDSELTPKVTWDVMNILNEAGAHTDSISQRIDHVFVAAESPKTIDVIAADVLLEMPSVEIDGRITVPLSDHSGVFVELKFSQGTSD